MMWADVTHYLAVGTTRTGKSYWARNEQSRGAMPAIYFNTQAEEIEPSWVAADMDSDLTMFVRPGLRINYVPDGRRKVTARELEVICAYLLARADGWPHGVRLIVEEADLLAPEGARDTALQMVAARGAKLGIHLTAITQSPAQLSKVVVRNCARHHIWPAVYTTQYYTAHGLDGELIERTLAGAPRHSWMQYEMGKGLTGPCGPL